MKLLALDISTTHVGYAIYDSPVREEIDVGCIDLSKIEDHDVRLDTAVEKVLALVDQHNIESATVEEFAKAFTPGLSSADTIINLAVFNSIISYELRKKGIPVTRLNVKHARKTLGIVLPKGIDGDQKKKLVHVHICKLSQAPALRRTNKTTKRYPVATPHKSTYDMADACVMGRAWIQLNTNK